MFEYFNEYVFWFVQEFHVAIASVCTHMYPFTFSPKGMHMCSIKSHSFSLILPLEMLLTPRICGWFLCTWSVIALKLFFAPKYYKNTQYYPNRTLFRAKKKPHSTFDCSRCETSVCDCMHLTWKTKAPPIWRQYLIIRRWQRNKKKKHETSHKWTYHPQALCHGSLHSSIERWKRVNEKLSMFSGMAE